MTETQTKTKTKPNSKTTSGGTAIIRYTVTLFLLVTLIIALLRWMPWSAPLALIEIPLHYLPKWLPLLLLAPLLFYWRQAFKMSRLRLSILGLGVVYFVFLHMDFAVPFKEVVRDDVTSNLRILSANLADVDATKFASLLRYQKPDVIVTQEIGGAKLAALLADASSQLFASSDQQGDPSDLSREPANSKLGGGYWRFHCERILCVASRHPFTFVEAQSRRFRGAWGVIGTAYDIDVDGEPLRLFNVHLETVRKGFENVGLTRINLESILNNAKNRKIEAELVASWVGQQNPIVIAGDFNMATGESLYREYFGQFRNAFTEVGFGFGHTKFTHLLSVRIDHLLSTEDVLPVAARVGMDIGSDHRPLLVDLALGL